MLTIVERDALKAQLQAARGFNELMSRLYGDQPLLPCPEYSQDVAFIASAFNRWRQHALEAQREIERRRKLIHAHTCDGAKWEAQVRALEARIEAAQALLPAAGTKMLSTKTQAALDAVWLVTPPVPDEGCVSPPDGDCIGTDCMHSRPAPLHAPDCALAINARHGCTCGAAS